MNPNLNVGNRPENAPVDKEHTLSVEPQSVAPPMVPPIAEKMPEPPLAAVNPVAKTTEPLVMPAETAPNQPGLSSEQKWAKIAELVQKPMGDSESAAHLSDEIANLQQE